MATVVYPPQGSYQNLGGALGQGLGQGFSQMVGMIVQMQMKTKMQEATEVRQQANKIITSMRKNPAMKNRLQEYDEWQNPIQTDGIIPMRKAETAPKEGSTAWAREVVKKFGDVASPAEELEQEMIGLKRRAMKLIQLQGEGGQGQPTGQGQQPTGGALGQLGLQAPPTQQGISPGVVLGLQKPSDPLAMLEAQLKGYGLLNEQNQTMIQGLRAQIAAQGEERAGKEFKVEEAGREAGRGIQRETLTATRTNNIYNRVDRRLQDIEQSRTMMPEQQLIEGVKVRVDGIKQLSKIDPEEAQKAALYLTDYIVSRLYDSMTAAGKADSPEMKSLVGDLSREVKALYDIAGISVQKVLGDRWIELQRMKRNEKEELVYREIGKWIRKEW